MWAHMLSLHACQLYYYYYYYCIILVIIGDLSQNWTKCAQSCDLRIIRLFHRRILLYIISDKLC